MRSKMLLVTFVVFGSILVAGALAATPRQAATDQYGTTPVIGAGTTDTTPTDVVAPTVTASSVPTTPSVSPPTTTDTSPTTPATTSTATTPTAPTEDKAAGAAAGAPAASAAAEYVEHLDFGRADTLPLHQPFKKLREDVVASIAQTPYQENLIGGKDRDSFGGITNAHFAAFAASPLLKLLSGVAAEPAGQAWGAQLVNVTPVAQQVFPALLGTDDQFVSFDRVVLTRRAKLAKGEAKFMDGVAKGLESTGIPVAYVERADVKKSFVKHFKKLGILTVDDVDTATGQLRLAQILTGQITTQKAVDEVKVDPASATIVDTDGSAGATPWLLLVLVLGGAGFAASGVLRHRGSRSRTSA